MHFRGTPSIPRTGGEFVTPCEGRPRRAQGLQALRPVSGTGANNVWMGQLNRYLMQRYQEFRTAQATRAGGCVGLQDGAKDYCSAARVGHIDVTSTDVRPTALWHRLPSDHYDHRYSEHNESRIAANACPVTLSCAATVLTPARKSSNGVLLSRLNKTESLSAGRPKGFFIEFPVHFT